jgi:hypothetical protein
LLPALRSGKATTGQGKRRASASRTCIRGRSSCAAQLPLDDTAFADSRCRRREGVCHHHCHRIKTPRKSRGDLAKSKADGNKYQMFAGARSTTMAEKWVEQFRALGLQDIRNQPLICRQWFGTPSLSVTGGGKTIKPKPYGQRVPSPLFAGGLIRVVRDWAPRPTSGRDVKGSADRAT